MSETRNDQILIMWSKGHSAGDIAWALNISRNSVIGAVFRARRKGDSRAVQRAPSYDGSKPRPAPTLERIRPLAIEGLSGSQIARKIGITQASVWKCAKRFGVELRDGRRNPIPEEVA